MSAKRKPFVIDYEIAGTLHLSSPNRFAVEARARSIITRCLRDLQDASVYCEADVAEPIDAQHRYKATP